MKRWLALLFACLALALVVAACGNSASDEGEGDAQNTEQPSESGSAGGGGGAEKESKASGGAQVTMKDIKFDPAGVTVKKGDTVTWTNEDTVGHDVTGDGFKSGPSGGLGNGDTYKHTFDKAGKFDYVCTVHPGMEGSVTVK